MSKMHSGDEHFLEKVFSHLADISRGDCVINDELILNTANELHQKILAGLIYLHEDLQLYKKDLIALKSTEMEYKMKALEDRNKELSQFTYAASHDLQEPLKTITSLIDMFLNVYDSKFDDEAKKYLQFISQAAKRMQALIFGLLNYSRIGSNRIISEFDCGKVLSEVINDLHGTIVETQAVVKVEMMPKVLGSEIEFRQLFQNLISNAIKFRRRGVRPLVKICAWKEQEHWLFKVEDNGIGIEKKYTDRIFIIFQRLHNREEYEGTGIGLANCRKIVESHGGRIWVESNPGLGSSFWFTIPFYNL